MTSNNYSADFQECIRFHGHLCAGLAIGYAAAKLAIRKLNASRAADEELVAIVENDSCAVDAIQVVTGCTFGKGNFIFKDWGKQVYTFYNRKSGECLRLSFRGPVPYREERHKLKTLIDTGSGTKDDRERLEFLKAETIREILAVDPEMLFQIDFLELDEPPTAQIVHTAECKRCGEATIIEKMSEISGRKICKECALKKESVR